MTKRTGSNEGKRAGADPRAARARSTEALTRPRYFSGMLLTPRDLEAEQRYVRDKQRRHNRCLHGYGVACGLDVSLGTAAIVVSPGLALDGFGEEIAVSRAVEADVPRDGSRAYLVIRYVEVEGDPVPAGEGRMECTRITEGFALCCEASDPCRGLPRDAAPTAIPLARLVRRRGRWRLDRTYRRPRAR